MEIKIQLIDDKGQVYQGKMLLAKMVGNKKKNETATKVIEKSKKVKPSTIIYSGLYQSNFFKDSQLFSDVEKKLSNMGYHFKKGSILMALKGATYLIKNGKKGKYTFIQKHPPAQ